MGKSGKEKTVLTLTPKIYEERRERMLEMLEHYKEQVETGEIVRMGIVSEKTEGRWSTEFSSSEDCRVDAAMLIELGMRRLGFPTK